METNNTDISRRSFLGGVAGVGALAAFGLAGCSPKAAGTAEAKDASGSASTAVANSNAVAVDDGSAAITVDWLGAAPEIAEKDIAETKDTDLVIVGAGNGGMVAGAYASDQKMDFILCEKGTEVGATRHWFNAVDTKPFVDQGIRTDRARLHGEWARYSSGTCDHNLINMWMNESGAMFEYIDRYMSAAGAVVIADDFAMPGGMDDELGITASMAGLAGGIFFIGYLFLQVPGGKLAVYGNG
ncbi:MAG: FAD-binding protein, partial [Gordonibacter sp.]